MCTRDSRESHRSRKLLKWLAKSYSLPWEFAIRGLLSRVSPTPDGFSTECVRLLTVKSNRAWSACFTICSAIFSTKIASRQQALLHHCHRKFIWIFNRWAREFTSHTRSRLGILFFFGTSFVWQSEKWRKESVKSILKKICFTTRILR